MGSFYIIYYYAIVFQFTLYVFVVLLEECDDGPFHFLHFTLRVSSILLYIPYYVY